MSHATAVTNMRRSSTALVALALLVSACVARATAVYTNNTSCTSLRELANEDADNVGLRSVSHGGRAASVTLVWGSEPAHAAAALLAALLRHVRLYSDVLLPRSAHPHSTAALAANVTLEPTGNYSDFIIGVSTAWEPKAAPPWHPRENKAAGLAGPRLMEFGVSSVPAHCRLFAWLVKPVRDRLVCRQHVRWSFYANLTALADCGFIEAVKSQGNVAAVEVLGVGNCNTTLQLLLERAYASKSTLHPRQVDHSDFVRTLQTANRSFLFLDYDIWKGAQGVSVVEPPPCVSIDFDYKQELDSAIAMRVADVRILEMNAPQFFQFVNDFQPSPESLRQILERQASGVDIEEAACEWALKNGRHVINDHDREKYDTHNYNIFTCYCLEDPDNDFIKELTKIVEQEVRNQTVSARWHVTMNNYKTNCSDHYNMTKMVKWFMGSAASYRLLGIVSLSVEGAAAASASAAADHVPLMLADVVPEDGTADADATWRVAGRPRHITRALHHFVRESGWNRVAVLSQPTKISADYFAALNDRAEIVLRQFKIPRHLREQHAQEVLEELRTTKARIVFVNANSQAAVTILTAAVLAGMGYSDGFVWVVREWQQDYVVSGTKHFTVSFWIRESEDIPPGNWRAQLYKKLNEKWPGRPWPPRTVSVVNAAISLLMGFKDVFQQFPETRQDLRSAQTIRLFEESLIETPIMGVSQRLRYKERSIEETFVFVDQYGDHFTRLATWRVNATSGAVRGKNESRATYLRPADLPHDDGTSGCIVRSGDDFDPTCHDSECACALLLLALTPAAVLLARRALHRRLARLQQEQQIQLIARRRHVATVLVSYLVERTALELHEELGAGRFGSVRLARLREPGRAPRYIAAKALRDNAAPAEESEFLREACTIASLNHAHIVRLVGVCIVNGPPLVLMELAFFGDLLGYLRARRHLVEGVGLEVPEASGEAENVSAEALTRLAREAAEALQYLSVRGVVHRDVRAANCLVDVRRSLKLADFGMARDTVAGEDGAPEYACRRRGLFPVLWMAPESLAHGVFSAASDVWALGVLVLELVTLGMRPYGTMSPLRVLEYVAAGGSPPLPLAATPQTRGLARQCWARAAERRPSAAEVAAYLAAWPLALHPVMLSESDEPADADSGFGESPSTLLPPDSFPLPRPAQ